MKLGSDFNASSPSEGDYVRNKTAPQLASTVRDLRTRLKDFFAQVFDGETGDFKDSVIPSAALVDSATNPSSGADFYQQVTVDSRGFVVKGSATPVYTGPRVFRAFYTSTGGWYETPEKLVAVPAVPRQSAPFSIPGGASEWAAGDTGYLYDFLVPAGITQLKIFLQCGGPQLAGDGTVPPEAFTSIEGALDVHPGTLLKVFIGEAGVGVGSRGASSIIATADYSQWISTANAQHPIGVAVLGNTQYYFGLRYRPMGAVNSPGGAVFEWYA